MKHQSRIYWFILSNSKLFIALTLVMKLSFFFNQVDNTVEDLTGKRNYLKTGKPRVLTAAVF